MVLRASEIEVAVIGAGAAGIGAAKALRQAGVETLLIDARPRLGGRAHTVEAGGYSLDLGCGWLHSADENPFVAVAQELDAEIDRTLPPWRQDRGQLGLADEEIIAFGAADAAFWEALETAVASGDPDRAAVELLPPGARWNPLIDAISTYVNGAELDRVSIADTVKYHDSGTDWRLPAGYGRLIARYADALPMMLDTHVHRVDHAGRSLAIETSRGTLHAGAAVIAVPTNMIADGSLRFEPELPQHRDAAAGLPLGFAEKVYFLVEGAQELAENGRFFGATDRAGTGTYHTRPFGRPIIEGYFGGRQARAMALAGEAAMVDFATQEIVGVLGSGMRARLSTLAVSGWAADPFCRGSYSHALPGRAAERARLAESVDDRIFFAGEATSPRDFSTAHGALESGRVAAQMYIATVPAKTKFAHSLSSGN